MEETKGFYPIISIDKIQWAHDLFWPAVADDVLELKRTHPCHYAALNGMLKVLCWILGHDVGQDVEILIKDLRSSLEARLGKFPDCPE